jgi:hypothetical protein
MSQDNPYSAPQASLRPEKFSKAEVWQVLGTGLVIGAILGGATNAINGWIGPSYFIHLLNWTEDIWIKAVIQGALEAGLYGLLNAFVFVLIANFFGRGIRSVVVIRKYLLSCAVAVSCVWVIGGLIGIFLLPAFSKDLSPNSPFPLKAFTDPGFCWTLGSLNLAVMSSWLITLVAGVIYARSK